MGRRQEPIHFFESKANFDFLRVKGVLGVVMCRQYGNSAAKILDNVATFLRLI
jgi:hypothetical protein